MSTPLSPPELQELMAWRSQFQPYLLPIQKREDGWERMVEDPSTPLEALWFLAREGSFTERRVVAASSRCNREMRNFLVATEDINLIQAVAENPNLERDEVEALMGGDDDIQLALAQNPATPPEILAGLTSPIHGSFIRSAALENPHCPQETLAHAVLKQKNVRLYSRPHLPAELRHQAVLSGSPEEVYANPALTQEEVQIILQRGLPAKPAAFLTNPALPLDVMEDLILNYQGGYDQLEVIIELARLSARAQIDILHLVSTGGRLGGGWKGRALVDNLLALTPVTAELIAEVLGSPNLRQEAKRKLLANPHLEGLPDPVRTEIIEAYVGSPGVNCLVAISSDAVLCERLLATEKNLVGLAKNPNFPGILAEILSKSNSAELRHSLAGNRGLPRDLALKILSDQTGVGWEEAFLCPQLTERDRFRLRQENFSRDFNQIPGTWSNPGNPELAEEVLLLPASQDGETILHGDQYQEHADTVEVVVWRRPQASTWIALDLAGQRGFFNFNLPPSVDGNLSFGFKRDGTLFARAEVQMGDGLDHRWQVAGQPTRSGLYTPKIQGAYEKWTGGRVLEPMYFVIYQNRLFVQWGEAGTPLGWTMEAKGPIVPAERRLTWRATHRPAILKVIGDLETQMKTRAKLGLGL